MTGQRGRDGSPSRPRVVEAPGRATSPAPPARSARRGVKSPCPASGGRVHAPPHWLQAVPPLTTKLSFPAQIRRGQVLNWATRVESTWLATC